MSISIMDLPEWAQKEALRQIAERSAQKKQIQTQKPPRRKSERPAQKTEKRSKYGNVKTGKNASRKEARRAEELRILERQGLIEDLREQVPFTLSPAVYESYARYGKNGKRLKDGQRLVERACVYVADFVYRVPGGDTVVEDTKGFRTKEYVVKRKWMLHEYGIRIKEV